MLVTIEGIDGTGKSTLIKKLPGIHSKEPGSPQVSINQKIRELVLENRVLTPLQRELLFYVDAMGHRNWILTNSDPVISDRGLWSHLAYVYGCLKTKQMDWDEYRLCTKLIERCCIKPDGVIYLKGDLELMNERLKGEKDVIESLGFDFFAWVLMAYEDLIALTKLPVLVLNARDSIETNVNKSCQFIQELTGPKQS